MGRLGTLLQLALAVYAVIAAVRIGLLAVHSPVWAVAVTCGAALCWVVRALLSQRITAGADLALLAAMLLGATVAAVPTNGVGVTPAAGSMLIVLGSTRMPRWTLWAWPLAAALIIAVSVMLDDAPTSVIATLMIVLALCAVGGLARRQLRHEAARRLQLLEREHNSELARIRAAADRVLTPERLGRRFPQLSVREAEVLGLIARGKSNDEIAAELFISVTTVKSHVNSLFAKMPARDRAQAIALALGTYSR